MAKPLQVALLGCGGIQRKHVRTLERRDDTQIAAFCDVSDASIDSLITRSEMDPAAAGSIPRFSDAGEMYTAVKPDVVSICTPHTLHFEQGMQALEAGSHVLMEKPMVTAAPDAHALAAKVRETGLKLLVAYNTPCSPRFQKAREMIRSEELGRLELVTAWVSQDWMRGTTGKWRQEPELSGGGMAYDTGAHVLNSLCWLVEQDIDKVQAFTDNVGSPVEINSTSAIRFKSGVLASVTIGGNCAKNGSGMQLLFTGGRMQIEPWSASHLRVWRGKTGEMEEVQVEGEATQPMDNLIESIHGRAQLAAGVDTGIIHSELMDAIYASAGENSG